MPENRIAVSSEIKRIFKQSGFIQDFRVGNLYRGMTKLQTPDYFLKCSIEVRNWGIALSGSVDLA